MDQSVVKVVEKSVLCCDSKTGTLWIYLSKSLESSTSVSFLFVNTVDEKS